MKSAAKMKVLMGCLLSMTSVMSVTATADDVRLGFPAYAGTGCPAGSASASLSDDKKTLSILFDSFTAEAGNTNGRQIDRKNCQVSIPVHVPNGLSVSIIGVDYRGFNGLPAGARSELRAEYFFAGSTGPKVLKQFRGPDLNDYTLHNDLLASAWVWSPCGADVNMRIASSIMAVTNSRFDQTQMTLDSIDLTAGMLFHFQFRQCFGGKPVGPLIEL
jgi:hypothetical protein